MRLTRNLVAITCIAIVLVAALVPSAWTVIVLALVVVLAPNAGAIVIRRTTPRIDLQRAALLALTPLRAPPHQA